MPTGHQRSRTKRRKTVNTPGGKSVIHYLSRNHKKAACEKCGKPLHGVARKSTLISKLKKTQRRPSRPYGGVLCSSCSREAIKEGGKND
jgi:large subunit ribosomal protein L34e